MRRRGLAALTNEHEVILRQFTETKGATGAMVRAVADVETLLCRIQPLTTSKRANLAQNGIVASHVVYFGDPAEINKLADALGDSKLTDDYHFQYTDRHDNTRTMIVSGEYDTDELGRLLVVHCQEVKAIDDN